LTSPAISRKPALPAPPALTVVETRLPADPFLLTRFERFYQEMVECRSQLGGHFAHARVSLQPNDVHGRLLSLLLEQEEQVSHSGTLLGVEMYRQAQRVMACLADEIFSASSLPAGTSWRSLEIELFAADKRYGLAPDGPCMKKLELLLQQDDPAYRELAEVYFYALALAGDEQHARQSYWRPLVEVIGGANGKVTEGGRVFGQNYAHTLAENRVATLPSAERWWLALALIVLAWLSVSWVLWTQLTNPIHRELRRIDEVRSIQNTLPQ
jgi:type VI secretion system protein ImpK